MLNEHLGCFRNERTAHPTICQFACKLQVPRAEGGNIDRNVRGSSGGAQSPAFAAGQGQMINLAFVGHLLSAGRQTDDLNKLARSLNRSIKRNAVPSFDDLRPACPKTEHEPTAG